MYLHKIHLDPRCREARRDLSDPYQLHSTLCRAFSVPMKKCPDGEYLWRLEPETNPAGYPRILVQSRSIPNWNGIGVLGWLSDVTPPIDLKDRLKLDSLKAGQRFRFRLRANPCVCRNGKRSGLMKQDDQRKWLIRKGEMHGFSPDIFHMSQERMLYGKRNDGGATISVYSVLFDGYLSISEPAKFRQTLASGIGHSKTMGLGLLTVAS